LNHFGLHNFKIVSVQCGMDVTLLTLIESWLQLILLYLFTISWILNFTNSMLLSLFQTFHLSFLTIFGEVLLFVKRTSVLSWRSTTSFVSKSDKNWNIGS
jgi:hypothetical protein